MENVKDDFAWGEAARIRARLDAPDCSAAERARLDQWRTASPENERAFAQVQAVSTRLSMSTFDARIRAMTELALLAGRDVAEDPSPDSEHGQHQHGQHQKTVRVATTLHSLAAARVQRQRADELAAERLRGDKVRKNCQRISASIAASVLVALGAIGFTLREATPDLPEAALAAHIITAPGKTPRQVTLADGSVVHLDVDAKLEVDLSVRERRIQLLSGRAFFEVAHDAQRPFIVTANGVSTMALGTQFEVQVTNSQTQVTLLEGSVAVSGQLPVDNSGDRGAEHNLAKQWNERLSPGQQVRVLAGSAPQRYDVDATNVVSWSHGWLVFQSTPLSEAIAQINRYSIKQVTLADASLSDLKIAGSFIAGDSDSIVNAMAEVLPIRVVDGGSREVLLFKRYDR